MERDYGGAVAQNIGVVYDLTPDEKAYLSTLGVDAEQLLATIFQNTAATCSGRC